MKKSAIFLLAIILCIININEAKSERFISSISINNDIPIQRIENHKLMFGNFFNF